MRNALILGDEELRRAANALGLEEGGDRPDVVLVDADNDDSVARATGLASLPRVFIATAARAGLLRAAGYAYVVERPVAPGSLGPVLFAMERARPRAARVVVCCAASGATGRTLLVANLTLRLARTASVVAVDATGTGALAWRLGARVAPWAEIASVGSDLGEAHLRLAAAERDGALILGGTGIPDGPLLGRVVELCATQRLVLIDAPAYRPPPELMARADRVLVCANPDPASAAATAALIADLAARDVHLVVSQTEERDAPAVSALFGRPASFLLPRDEAACRASLLHRGAAGGRLGRAYDALAEIVAAEREA
ncbi:MAG: hypothetical protein AUH85_01215 [Chloroflexi bacterium 13_1_40CM_4_68_4]|nr:MAG: hypothetical protein AUH85_01215 [Chloroflexi bacterium 13_1_40CM_4_68_4]